MENLDGKRAKIVGNAPGYVKSLWGKCGVIESDVYGYKLRFDAPVDIGGTIVMESVRLYANAFELEAK